MIEWNTSLSTGHNVIDESHQKLIQALNDLGATLDRSADADHILEVLSFLIGYTREHFAYEEDYMRRVHCPALTENIKAHSSLLVRLSEWVPRLQKAETKELATEIFNELTMWITNHILRVDCQLRKCNGPKIGDHPGAPDTQKQNPLP